MKTFKLLFTRAMIWNDLPVSWSDMTLDYESVASPSLLEDFLVTNNIAVFDNGNGDYCISTRLGSFVYCSDNSEFFFFEEQINVNDLFVLLNTDELTRFHDWYNVYPMHPSIEHQTTTGPAHYGIYNSVDAGIFGDTRGSSVGQVIEKTRENNMRSEKNKGQTKNKG